MLSICKLSSIRKALEKLSQQATATKISTHWKNFMKTNTYKHVQQMENWVGIS